MGRIEKSQGLAPPSIRKDIRAKQARHIINKTVPAVLASNSRARKGSESSELIVNPASNANALSKSKVAISEDAAYIKRKGQGRRKVKTEGGGGADVVDGRGRAMRRGRQDSVDRDFANVSTASTATAPLQGQRKVRVMTTDTLTAASILTHPSRPRVPERKVSKKTPNVCILNMASPLRPGGGVLTGATSQEEFLCARTTLLPSLNDSFYRLPEFGAIWTSDVLVFRNSLSLGDAKGELELGERYWVDVISAGMLRFPELEGEDEAKRLSKADHTIVERKMRAVLRIAVSKGVKKLVLGAWGCGAFGNPVADIAQSWNTVLNPGPAAAGRKGKASPADSEKWPGLEEVIFAISNRKMAADFAQAFGGAVEVEAGPHHSTEEDDDDDEEEDKVAEELRTKIQEMESQISKVWDPNLKTRMGTILDSLKAQLDERQSQAQDYTSSSVEDEEPDTQDAQLTPGVSDDSEDGDECEEDEYAVNQGLQELALG